MDAFLGTLAGVTVGWCGPTYVTQRGADKRREKNEATQTVAQLYDDAIAAVAEVEASRMGSGFAHIQDTFPAITGAKKDEMVELLEAGTLKRFLDAKMAARAALAALHPYSTDLKRFSDKSEAASQEDFDELISPPAGTPEHNCSPHRRSRGWPG